MKDKMNQSTEKPTEPTYVVALGRSISTPNYGIVDQGKEMKLSYMINDDAADEVKKSASKSLEKLKKNGLIVTELEYKKILDAVNKAQ